MNNRTTLTQRNLTISNMQYSISEGILVIELNTTAHNLQGTIPITIAGAISQANEFDSALINGLKDFNVVSPTKLRLTTSIQSALNFVLKNATGTITASINNLSLSIKNTFSSNAILIYTYQDTHILDGASIHYNIKLLNDDVGHTELLIGTKGIIRDIKLHNTITFTVINATALTNITISVQI